MAPQTPDNLLPKVLLPFPNILKIYILADHVKESKRASENSDGVRCQTTHYYGNAGPGGHNAWTDQNYPRDTSRENAQFGEIATSGLFMLRSETHKFPLNIGLTNPSFAMLYNQGGYPPAEDATSIGLTGTDCSL